MRACAGRFQSNSRLVWNMHGFDTVFRYWLIWVRFNK